MTTKVEIFTDGACKGNPGTGGWGALLVAGDHEKEIFGGEPNTTNNRMELRAVIEALTVDLPDERDQLTTRADKRFTELRGHVYAQIQRAKQGARPSADGGA